jgi:dTDP-4-amino-4,6-dideoxygalactose transaminase
MKYKIPFNKPFLTGKELIYIKEAVGSGMISGNGVFTKKCQELLQEKYNFKKCLLTTSCTDALEMAAILANINFGDEIILPSFTFVSTANAFILRGARLVFCDSSNNDPNINVEIVESLITKRTKAIVVVHYAGVACDMDNLLFLARRYGLFIIEDAAQAIDSFYKDKPLGSIGNLGCFSFHETKNIMTGEGGMLVINDDRLLKRAEIIWEKGTNRASFYRGEVDKYGWVDIGSSYLPSEIAAAFLYAQLENINLIQDRRKELWLEYCLGLKHLEEKGHLRLPTIPEYATNNAHMFYIICKNISCRSALIDYLKLHEICAVFHYLPLHQSTFFRLKHDGRELSECIRYSECLLRLPLFYELTDEDVTWICLTISNFFDQYIPS